MKIRNGFVSNSSSSSFIISYRDICGLSEVKEVGNVMSFVEDTYIDYPDFAFIFESGSSGECAKMLVCPDEEIKQYIKEHKLFTSNKRFNYLLEKVILLEHLEEEDYDFADVVLAVQNQTLGVIKSLLEKDKPLQFTEIPHYITFDNSSIYPHTKNKLEKFKKFVGNRGVFDPAYAKYGSMTEEDYEEFWDED
jgi:hypothetical protein